MESTQRYTLHKERERINKKRRSKIEERETPKKEREREEITRIEALSHCSSIPTILSNLYPFLSMMSSSSFPSSSSPGTSMLNESYNEMIQMEQEQEQDPEQDKDDSGIGTSPFREKGKEENERREKRKIRQDQEGGLAKG